MAPLTVFVKAPSFESLEARLRGQASDEERIHRRLETAKEGLTRTAEFQHVIVNDEVDRAAAELAGIIRERLSTGCIMLDDLKEEGDL
ncbi:MAG: hypothetical protein U0792_25585 [Gemmataceae bacterium]